MFQKAVRPKCQPFRHKLIKTFYIHVVTIRFISPIPILPNSILFASLYCLLLILRSGTLVKFQTGFFCCYFFFPFFFHFFFSFFCAYQIQFESENSAKYTHKGARSASMSANMRESAVIIYKFLFPILRFLAQNHIALLKDRFLKKMPLKRANTHRIFFAKLKAEIILLTVQ